MLSLPADPKNQIPINEPSSRFNLTTYEIGELRSIVLQALQEEDERIMPLALQFIADLTDLVQVLV